MKLLTPYFIDAFKGPVINIHPSLLPKYPGIHSIKESFESGDKELGITIMRIDTGIDMGPVLLQKSFLREGSGILERIEARIHGLEHDWFPHVAIQLLDDIDRMVAGRRPEKRRRERPRNPSFSDDTSREPALSYDTALSRDVDRGNSEISERCLMRILVLGSGGREHAIAWKLSSSKNVERVFVGPGKRRHRRGGHESARR